MRCSIFALLVLAVNLFGAPADSREVRLAKLKLEFPRHTAGEITDRTDSTVRACYFKYKKMVDALTVANIADEMAHIRDTLDHDAYFKRVLKESNDQVSPATKAARRMNEDWLRTRMKPYVQKLEAFQRSK